MTAKTATKAPYVCEDCGREFDKPQGLSGHRLSHQVQEPCPECGRDNFTTPSQRARHRNSEHGVALKGQQPKIANTEWDADDILSVLVGSLWPKGSVPVAAISPLITWREATLRLLNTLSAQTQT